MNRRKKAKVVHGPTHHYAPLAMSPVVSFDKQSTPQFPSFHSPITRPPASASTSPASVPTRTSSYSNILPLRSVASDSPLSSPSVSLSSAPLPSPVAASEPQRPVNLQNDPYLLSDDELPDVDTLIAPAQPQHNTQLVQPLQHSHSRTQQQQHQHADEVPATPTPPNHSQHTASPQQPSPAATAPPVQRTLSYLLADSSPPPIQPSHLPTASLSAAVGSYGPDEVEPAVGDDYPSLSQLLNEEEEERRQLVEEEDFASLDELLHQSDDESTAAALRSSTQPTQQTTQPSPSTPTQLTQPTQVLSPRRLPDDEDENQHEASDVDELAATQVLQQRSWVDESQSQSQRPPDEDEQAGDVRVADVSVSVSCGVSDWQSSPVTSSEGDVRVLARPHLLHTGRILLSNSSSLSPTPG